MVTDQDLAENTFALNIIERVSSTISLLGSLFVVATFIASTSFHKPINRMVFYASFGNILTTVGTLVSASYVDQPDSAVCQLQAFLIQMFMPADAFWTLAMAINVYLTFYHKFDAVRLRKMELPYFLLCYGIPLVPAFTFIFVRNDAGHRIYGNATLWCWITPEWDVMRIAGFYAPIWVIMVITCVIYVCAGHTIYEKRAQLRTARSGNAILANIADSFGTIRTTEVVVTSDLINDPTAVLGISSPMKTVGPENAYSVTISSDNRGTEILMTPQTPATGFSPTFRSKASLAHPSRRPIFEANNAAWSYTKCAILFFAAILITWIPSSANRVFSVINHGGRSLPLEYMSALVLPLQGFWNAVIYTITSWTAVKLLFASIRHGTYRWRQPAGSESLPDTYSPPQRPSTGRIVDKYRSESTTELDSRPPSREPVFRV